MGSVYPKGKRLYFKVKVDGVWRNIRTEFTVGQERQARAMLDRLEERMAAGADSVGDLGPVTVARYAAKWIKGRELHVRTWKNDEAVLRLHVLPTLGALRLDAVRAKHLVDLVRAWRSKPKEERLAPKSIYNAYSTVSALFRDAELEGLIDFDPCKLTKHQLGPKVDANPEWRPTALFTLAELEQLISDERIPMDRRVMYGLMGIGATRHGEAAGLKFRNVQPELTPLGMLYIANNYQHPLPKGDVCRPVPIHPTLAAMLAEWRLHGWARMMGRQPTPDDLVLPRPPGTVSKFGPWRQKSFTYDRLEQDLRTLGLRHRRGHDLRRTMISLCRSNGANRDILRRATHKPPKEVIEGYTTFEWEVVCAEVAKHPVKRAAPAQVITLKRAASAGPEPLVPGLVPPHVTAAITGGNQWPSPDSNKGAGPRASIGDGGSSGYLPSAEEAVAVGVRAVEAQSARSAGTKVPSPSPLASPPARLVRDLIKAARDAGAPDTHPALVQARAWLKGGGH